MNYFLKLSAENQPHSFLPKGLPQTLWVKGFRVESIDDKTVLRGRLLQDNREVSLAKMDGQGRIILSFDILSTIDGILLEEYHNGLVPSIEMKLPFNYSRIPHQIKGAVRNFKVKATKPKRIDFPSRDLTYPADWLKSLAESSGFRFSVPQKWPDGKKAALVITHDADTNWIFKNPVWLKRICHLEAKYGVAGTWYCVPQYSQGKEFEDGVKFLSENGCEIGCHGYNHDAKFAISKGKEFQKRLEGVKKFSEKWQMKGFRSEWMWRSPEFLKEISKIFMYDSSVPSFFSAFTKDSNNGCGTCFPYYTFGHMVEIPLTVPMDEYRYYDNHDVETFWDAQVKRIRSVFQNGGLAVLCLHPQPHQSANLRSLGAFEKALEQITGNEHIWQTTAEKVARWFAQ